MIISARSSKCALAPGVLRRSQWFLRFDPATLDSFLDAGQVVVLSRGEALCRRGAIVEVL